MASQLGAYIVQHSYRIEAGREEDLNEILQRVEAWAHELGVAHFEVWSDADDPTHVTEIHGFDSWAHFIRLSKKETPRAMQFTYADLDELIVGGLDAIVTHSWQPRARIRPR